MSEKFPGWITADTVLRKMIAPKLGAYVSTEGSEITVSFLPEDVIALVPPEDRACFLQAYQEFAAWAFSALELEPYFKSRFYCAICNELLSAISAEIELRIKVFSQDHIIGFSGEFLSRMGVGLISEPIEAILAPETEKDPGA